MTADTNATSIVAFITNITEYAGPAALSGLSSLGATIYVHDRTFSDPAARDSFTSKNPGVNALPGRRIEVADAILAREGRIDVLIENATAVGERHTTQDNDSERLRAWLDGAATELILEPFKLLNHVSTHMILSGGGAVVLISSESWEKPQSGSVYYSAMRAAFPSLALGAARDLAASDIQVNCISPNYLESAEYYPPAVWSTPEKQKELHEAVPVGRLNTPEELGKLVAFLASRPTPFLTGSNFKIDGGALV